MAATYMGFEGELFYGSAGSTGATRVSNCTDLSYDTGTETGDTTVRGDGSGPPIATSEVVIRDPTITWTMLNVASDTALAALLTAAYAGTLVAIRLKDHAAGKGYDGDCHLSIRFGKPLRGSQTIEFTAKPSNRHRVPQLYV